MKKPFDSRVRSLRAFDSANLAIPISDAHSSESMACHERGRTRPSRMEPWGFEPQIQPCHGRVIPFHYGPGLFKNRVRNPKRRAAQVKRLLVVALLSRGVAVSD